MRVEVPFTDPILSSAHKMRAAARIATDLKNQVGMDDAVRKAEAALYEQIYSQDIIGRYGSLGNNMTPQSIKKKTAV